MKRRSFVKSGVTAVVGLAAGASGSNINAAERQQAPQFRTLGKTGFKVFPVIYGGIVSMNDGQAASDNYIAWAIDRGVNYFDVAPLYGDAQEKLGKSLGSHRKEIYLACKSVRRRAGEVEQEMKQSFELLHTDFFDNYQLHMLSAQQDIDLAFGPGGAMEFLVKAKADGRIRKLGITAHSEEIGLKAMSLYDFDTVMFPLNYHMHLHNKMGETLLSDAKKRSMGVLAIKSLIARRWKDRAERQSSNTVKSWCKPIDVSDKELAIAALKYTIEMGADVLVPPGDFRDFSFVVDNIGTVLQNPLNSEELALLRQNFLENKEFPFFQPNGQMFFV